MIAKKYEPPKVSMPARDGAGKFEFKEGTGPITQMVSYGTFMEIYKVDATAQLRSPEDVDPERINPNAPWVCTVDMKAGSGNEIVSRLCIQSSELLKAVSLPAGVGKEVLLRHMHKIKEELLQCQQISQRVSSQVREIIAKVERNDLQRDNYGRGFNPFPQVKDLQHEANNFLIIANKVIRAICGIPRLYVPVKESSNFDYLVRTLVTVVDADSSLLKFVTDQVDSIRRIVNLRNYAEHARDEKQTEITNFKVQADGRIRVPVWGMVKGEAINIHDEMEEITLFLRTIAEGMFILSLQQFRLQDLPMMLVAVEKSNPQCPLFYEFMPDMSKFKFGESG
ncbi:hypothetical protein JYG33_09435 [Alcaligenes sp. SORT26]|uniref:hypothetical protein n=1 Tax=Alcaligenes sp. SORT26 TaxID=2813780 RepID=UPI001A9ED888|nr:hypothetical protein [Alcaligenes sp. SORT26]QTC01629.1 hypothetical protein JYG33_09435 [Alcaligenes sp. SORT26]